LLTHDPIEAGFGISVRISAIMRQRITQDSCRLALLVVDVAETFERRSRARHRVQTVVVLKLPGKLLFQRAACVCNEALQAVSGGLVEGHAHRSPSMTKEPQASLELRGVKHRFHQPTK
jgi:hypothetical protein